MAYKTIPGPHGFFFQDAGLPVNHEHQGATLSRIAPKDMSTYRGEHISMLPIYLRPIFVGGP